MRSFKLLILGLISVGLIFSVAIAENAGSAVSGKALFMNPNSFSGTKACNECHPNGKGLEKSGSEANLLETINECIVNGNKGNAIPEDSQHMKDMVEYIKSLGAPAAPGYGTSGYGSPGYRTPSSGGAPGYK